MNLLSKTKAKELGGLVSKKKRDLHSLFIAEGEKCVRDLLGYFKLYCLVCTLDYYTLHEDELKRYVREILISDRRGLELISSLNSVPDVIAVFYKPENEIKVENLDKNKLYLLLDEIQDPGNLGTIIRTCDWFGVYEIYASPNSVDVYSPKVVQATMGSLSRVKVNYVDLKALIEQNPEMDVTGTFLEGENILKKGMKPSGFLIMGNEGRGISDDLKELIKNKVTIPPQNESRHPDSLNVAIATAILLSHIKT